MGADELPPLGSAPVTHTIRVPQDSGTPIDTTQVPGAPAVVVFEGSGGRTVLIATTSNARELIRKKLCAGPDEPGTGSRWRTDYRAVVEQAQVIRVGSTLEAESVYLAQARERLPEAYAIASERWRAWFVHVDPDAAFPEWSKTNLLGLVGGRSAGKAKVGPRAGQGVLLGPFPDKDAAGRWIEGVIDAFDLCRYHHLLVLAPEASACAYKEMGKCPAPCDGSEPMEEYRRRTREAVALIAAGGVGRAIHTLRESPGSTADTGKGSLGRKTAERLERLDKPAFSHVTLLDRWRAVLVLPGVPPKSANLVLMDRGDLMRLGAVIQADCQSISRAIEAAESFCRSAPAVDRFDQRVESIGVVARWLFLPKNKRKGVAVHLSNGRFDADAIARACRSVARGVSSLAEIESMAIENQG